MKILCGTMEFGEFTVAGGPAKSFALVHQLQSVVHVVGQEFDCEGLLTQYDAYSVVDSAKTEIFYSSSAVAELCAALSELIGAAEQHSMSDDPDIIGELAQAAAVLSKFEAAD